MIDRLSLRGRLFLLLILPLVLVAVAVSFVRYAEAARLSRELYDNTLLAVALTISRDVVLSEGDMLTQQLLEDLITVLGDPVFYRVTGPGNKFVTGYSTAPSLPPELSMEEGEPVFFDSTSQGRPVRVVAMREFISEPQFGGWVVVEVWQTVTQRTALSRQLVAQSILMLGSLILTAALILWFGIQLGLKPMLDLREAIASRSADDLRPIRRWVPPEMRPLVATTNSLFDRLTRAFNLRDAFISDAAHQMRNPVAAMQSEAEAAISAPNEAELRSRIADLAETARATSRLTSQLLSLERVKGRSLQALSQSVDLVMIVRDRVRLLAEAQLRRGVEVAFTVTGEPRPITCDPVLVEEMVTNILDNAARYGLKPDGHLEVTVTFLPDQMSMSFVDDGPGVPAEYSQRIFDRFFRVDEDQQRGCGLGLAIVADVAEIHDGTASCRNTAQGFHIEVMLRR